MIKHWKLQMQVNLLCPRVQQSLSRHSIFLPASSEKSSWTGQQHKIPHPWVTTSFSHYCFYSHYYGGEQETKRTGRSVRFETYSASCCPAGLLKRELSFLPPAAQPAHPAPRQPAGKGKSKACHPPAAVIGFFLSHHHRNTRVYPLCFFFLEWWRVRKMKHIVWDFPGWENETHCLGFPPSSCVKFLLLRKNFFKKSTHRHWCNSPHIILNAATSTSGYTGCSG